MQTSHSSTMCAGACPVTMAQKIQAAMTQLNVLHPARGRDLSDGAHARVNSFVSRRLYTRHDARVGAWSARARNAATLQRCNAATLEETTGAAEPGGKPPRAIAKHRSRTANACRACLRRALLACNWELPHVPSKVLDERSHAIVRAGCPWFASRDPVGALVEWLRRQQPGTPGPDEWAGRPGALRPTFAWPGTGHGRL